MIPVLFAFDYFQSAFIAILQVNRRNLLLLLHPLVQLVLLAVTVGALRQGLAGLKLGTLLDSNTPIQPLLIGENADAVRLSQGLLARGLLVPAIRTPTVPAGTARLRITLSAAHSADDVAQLVGALHALA